MQQVYVSRSLRLTPCRFMNLPMANLTTVFHQKPAADRRSAAPTTSDLPSDRVLADVSLRRRLLGSQEPIRLGQDHRKPPKMRVDLKKGSRYDIWPFPLCQGITRDDVRQARLDELHHLR